MCCFHTILRTVLAARGGKPDERCTCGSGEVETREHWRLRCKLSEAAMEAVERRRSEALAAVGATFWFDVLRRVGYWEWTSGRW